MQTNESKEGFEYNSLAVVDFSIDKLHTAFLRILCHVIPYSLKVSVSFSFLHSRLKFLWHKICSRIMFKIPLETKPSTYLFV